MNTQESVNVYFVAAYEAGAENTPVPTWAANEGNPLRLNTTHHTAVQRVEVTTVPGAFQLLNVFSPSECERFIKTTKTLKYTQDASVSLPRSIRHNENLVWVVDNLTHDIIWNRCKALMYDHQNIYNGKN